ncbi:MAG: DUF2142 domain-containing protein [Rhodospirillales bacterium]|nr:DUF2142 domain-containing protein [Rhodospirillales bacterium]
MAVDLQDRSSPRPEAMPKLLAGAFAIYGLVAVALLAVTMPPFQNPDELTHFLRAAQVAEGGVIGRRFAVIRPDGTAAVTAGGRVDPALPAAARPFRPIQYDPQVKARRAMWAPRFGWSAARAWVAFPNTAIYPPFFYLPAALGVLAGRAAGLTVVQTLVLSRLLTGVASMAVGVAAIGCAGAAAVWLFAILTLPMSLALIASSSQDALMLACSALAAALLVRGMRAPWRQGTAERACLVAVLCLVTMARPPYGGMALLPLALPSVPLRRRLLAAGVVLAAIIAWSALAATAALTATGVTLGGLKVDPAAQAALLLRHPLLALRVARTTIASLWRVYLQGFIGWLGWLDTRLPRLYRIVAAGMLLVAAAATMLGRGERTVGAASRLVIAAAVLSSVVAVFAIEYLTWTVPGALVVDGVQGRYFLPLALVGGAALPALGTDRWARVRQALVLAVAAFPIVSLGIVMRAIVLRYYLS